MPLCIIRAVPLTHILISIFTWGHLQRTLKFICIKKTGTSKMSLCDRKWRFTYWLFVKYMLWNVKLMSLLTAWYNRGQSGTGIVMGQCRSGSNPEHWTKWFLTSPLLSNNRVKGQPTLLAEISLNPQTATVAMSKNHLSYHNPLHMLWCALLFFGEYGFPFRGTALFAALNSFLWRRL